MVDLYRDHYPGMAERTVRDTDQLAMPAGASGAQRIDQENCKLLGLQPNLII